MNTEPRKFCKHCEVDVFSNYVPGVNMDKVDYLNFGSWGGCVVKHQDDCTFRASEVKQERGSAL